MARGNYDDDIALAALVDAARDELEAARTIVVMRHIVFARPEQLHRHADLLGDVSGFSAVVVSQTAAEATAATAANTILRTWNLLLIGEA